jgi:natural product biosynthesis luciferase-like monooxygenase protein
MKTIDEQKGYWLKRLAGRPGVVTLPSDRERLPVSSFLRETASLTLGAESCAKVKAFAARDASQPSVVLLAALYAVLYRYTGSAEIPVGALLGDAAAPAPGKLLVLWTELAGDLTAEALVRQARLGVDEAVANSECPFADALETIGPGGGTPDAPLFQVAFKYSSSSSPANGDSDYADDLARCDLVVQVKEEDGALAAACEYDAELFDATTIERFLQHYGILLGGMIAEPASRLAGLPMMTEPELKRILEEWNNTKTDFPKDACIHQLFEAQVQRTPGGAAVVFRDEKLSYCQLNARANQLAHRLRKLGVGPDTLVGICVERSMEMIVGLLGILKAGGAYVPLDPGYPRERLSFMLEDANVKVLLTQQKLLNDLPQHSAKVICLDSASAQLAEEPEDNLAGGVTSDDLAYVIYTSGSTGKPKGVMITHRNVVNFFAGMDQSMAGDGPGVWLAVTSISFDISVLELFWTLSRGFKVVIYKDDHGRAEGAVENRNGRKKKIDFSLFYFASDEGQDAGNRYRLLLEGAKFADRHGFDAVWTPERHFHAFGGLYPNPSVTSAAVAAVTERIKIRAGSVVLPLQSPIRVAEEWSMVDNLSQGRVGVSFASGWQINDFVLAPQNYAARKELMLREIETVRKLWRGETLPFAGVDGKEVRVKILPRPVQPELPIWVTATGNPETFRVAGQLGANLLTHLVGQKTEDLAEKIRVYRKAWQEQGHAGEGHVTVMLHTFVGRDLDAVRETVRKPFSDYLRSSVDLLKNSPWGFAASRLSPESQLRKVSTGPADLSESELSALLEHAFDGYFENNSLFGTPDVCLRMADQLRGIGVDEIACLIDFGVDSQKVIESLPLLNEVRERCNAGAGAGAPAADYSLAGLAREHRATHFQCTPSMAGMLAGQAANQDLFGRLHKLLIGGEAFPAALAKRLKEMVPGSIHNMYGPTETTVWSATQQVGEVDSVVPIGRPIANTEIYLLNEQFRPVPVGVPGELCIGGAGVVRGYLNRPKLTAERFIRDPFSDAPDARLYRTGDLARYRGDGSIEFLGRMDHQVKIRGHRIELGEIEALVNEHPAVREAVVIVREDNPEDKRIVAYAILKGGMQLGTAEMKDYLKGKLPIFMLPAHVVQLEAFPQTPNKKIDRKALPPPKTGETDTGDAFEAPRTPVEQALAKIWGEALGVEQVSRKDNFFELGGHSLLAAKLFGEIERTFQKKLPLSTLFETRTLEELALVIQDDKSASPRWSSLVPIQPAGSKPPIFCVHGGPGNVLFYRDLAALLAPEYPLYGLHSLGLDGKADRLTRIEDMAAHYLSEIRSLQPQGPYLLGGYCMGGAVAYEMAQRLVKDGQKVAFLALFDTYNFNGTAQTTSVGQKLSYWKQKIGFHWSNIAQLDLRGKVRYFADKIKIARTRELARLSVKLSNISKRVQLGEAKDELDIFLEDVNQQAGYAYKPVGYPGKVTLFRPRRNYSFLRDPQMGWAGFAAGGLEIVELPVNPGGMFVEPYVRNLAENLRNRLDGAL